MKSLFVAASAHKAVTVVLAATVVGGGSIALGVADDSRTATVTGVVDGDTIDVRYDGEEHRIRLLNVDTPESVAPDRPVECLGPEASQWLEQRLPAGTEVRLQYDQEVVDGYGRELAAVFLGDDLVNADIARAGLGVPMSIEPNTKYLPPVQDAHAEARSAGRGLYSPTLECAVPTEIGHLEEAVTSTLSDAPAPAADLGDFAPHAAELAALAVTAENLRKILDGDVHAFPLVAYGAADVTQLRYRVQAVQRRLNAAAASNAEAREVVRQRLEEAARQAAEEARRAAEEAARKAAEEAARRAAEAKKERERTTDSSGTPQTTSAPTRSSSDSGSGLSGYTGCRSYAPGGKTWTPIPC